MGVAVSFQGYTPPARFDAVPWTDAQIEEAPTEDGTYAVIDTVSLGVPDADPANPDSRSFTTVNGTGDDLWYRVVFLDGSAGTSQPTAAVQNALPTSTTRDLCTLADVQTYVPGYVSNAATDAKLQQLITAESEQFAADTYFEFVGTEDALPAARVFSVFPGWGQRIHVGALASTDGLAVALVDELGVESSVDLSDVTVFYGPRRQPTAGWQPITGLEIRTPDISEGQLVKVTGNWGYPTIPNFVREAVAATVLLRYLSDVADTGTALSDAIDNVSIRGLVARRMDAIATLQPMQPPILA